MQLIRLLRQFSGVPSAGHLALPIVLSACVGLSGHASAASQEPATCKLGGPAGTASIIRLELPRGAAALALEVTTPTSLTAPPGTVVASGPDWHMATGIAIVRADTLRLVASRWLQSGSAPRSLAVDNERQAFRQSHAGTGAVFNHVGGNVPDTLPRGSYYLVAFGTDGSPKTPNGTWSAAMNADQPFRCAPLDATTRIFDYNQADFTGGQQVSGPGAGVASDGSLRLAMQGRVVLGMIDARTQGYGSAAVRYTLARGGSGSVSNGMLGFSGPSGRYTFRQEYEGTFPQVLICGVTFDAR